MIPIQDVLNRIRWDPDFAQGEFTIAYYDRIKKDLVTVPLKATIHARRPLLRVSIFR